jgi:hypothetical protein
MQHFISELIDLLLVLVAAGPALRWRRSNGFSSPQIPNSPAAFLRIDRSGGSS